MDHTLLAVLALIGVALIFDYINGFHDAANSIATVVSTRVLSPGQAVAWAAFFNFAAAFLFGTGVAQTVGSGMVDLSVVTFAVIFAGLMGAIVWDHITWYYGLPTSSSHALIGGYAGAAVAKAGFGAFIVSGWTKTLIFIILAPLIGSEREPDLLASGEEEETGAQRRPGHEQGAQLHPGLLWEGTPVVRPGVGKGAEEGQPVGAGGTAGPARGRAGNAGRRTTPSPRAAPRARGRARRCAPAGDPWPRSAAGGAA